jgi:CHAT domain-containing protein
MRGFFYAGATTVVASLWRVDDRATSELMMEFYRRLPAETPDVVLARAQQAVRKKYPHPSYWAAFQISGGV